MRCRDISNGECRVFPETTRGIAWAKQEADRLRQLAANTDVPQERGVLLVKAADELEDVSVNMASRLINRDCAHCPRNPER